jgi:hypothetical protein
VTIQPLGGISMDSLEFLTSDFVSEETSKYFSQLKRKLELEDEYLDYLQRKREKLVNQAIELGLLDSLETEFLETDTICDLIKDLHYYLANPAE